MPDTKAPVEEPYGLLPCDCNKNFPGKTAVELGPLWAGPLFDADYLDQMKNQAKQLKLSNRVQNLLDLMISESKCSSEVLKTAAKSTENGCEPSGSKRCAEEPMLSAPPAKKHKPNREFAKLVTSLQQAGFRASRTHFDTECIRTDATLAELKQIVCASMTDKS